MIWGFCFIFFLVDLALAWISLKCYTASVNIYNTEERSSLLHCEYNMGVRPPEDTEEEPPRRDIILSLYSHCVYSLC